jgi:hypothetical protein
MNKTKKLLAAAGVASALIMGVSSQPAAEAAAEAVQTQPAVGYTYTSKVYGYTIQCPKKPNVIPASMLYEARRVKC